MKKKLLVLLIAAIPMLMPNVASAVALEPIPVGLCFVCNDDYTYCWYEECV